MAAPTIQAIGTANFGTTGSVTYTPPTHATNDILLFIGESGATTGLTTSTTGWAHVTNSPRAQGSNVTSISLIWKRAASSSEPNLVVAASANHQVGQIICIRGCITTGDPWDFTPTTTSNGGAGTAITILGGTTTVADTLVFWCGVNSADTLVDQFTSISGPGGITGFTTTTQDFNDSGNGGGFVVCTGVKATAGATGSVTATTTSGSWSALSLAFVPAASGPNLGTAVGAVAWVGVANGARQSAGTAAGAVSWAGVANGARASRGTSTGAISWAGVANGARASKGTAVGTVLWNGGANGARPSKGNATGTITWSGVANGVAPTVGGAAGSASGAITWVGVANGKATRRGTATGAISWTGVANGKRVAKAASTGTVTWVGAANGKRVPKATAAGAVTWNGATNGSRTSVGFATGTLTWVGLATGTAGTVITAPTPDDRIYEIPAHPRIATLLGGGRQQDVDGTSRIYQIPDEPRTA